MRFFNIDQHISIIADMHKIFTDMGHQVDDWSISNHTWVLGKQKMHIPLLEGDGWKKIITHELWNPFYDTYKNVLKDYDCFISCYSPYFAMLYKRFNKPVIINTPIRYEHPLSFCPEQWNVFNDFIRDGYDNGKLILVANNLYDKFYCEAFTQRPWTLIPSLCEYIGGTYQPQKNSFIYYSRKQYDSLRSTLLSKALPGRFYPHDILKFKGIIHIPYQISTMSIFEQYTCNVPLLLPNIDFLMSLYESSEPVLREVSWNNILSGPSGSSIKGDYKYDPNDYKNMEAVRYWIKFADFYNEEWMPHITLFNSFEEANELMASMDTNKISNLMKETNIERKKRIYKLWEIIIKRM